MTTYQRYTLCAVLIAIAAAAELRIIWDNLEWFGQGPAFFTAIVCSVCNTFAFAGFTSRANPHE